MNDLSHFTIYRQPCDDEQRLKEADDLHRLFWRLEKFLKLDDVRFGQPPNEPDFVFDLGGKHIGCELTDLNPKIFGKRGYLKRDTFRTWKAEVIPTEAPQKFDWGSYSLRDSTASLEYQVARKRKKAEKWVDNFSESWLLLHVASGSPFSQILGGPHQVKPGRENDVADFLAKSLYCVHSVCKECQPFDCVILFMQDGFLAFPSGPTNPYNLPTASEEILERGALVSDRFLDWQKQSKSVVKAA
jgi:hypothetical protein